VASPRPASPIRSRACARCCVPRSTRPTDDWDRPRPNRRCCTPAYGPASYAPPEKFPAAPHSLPGKLRRRACDQCRAQPSTAGPGRCGPAGPCCHGAPWCAGALLPTLPRHTHRRARVGAGSADGGVVVLQFRLQAFGRLRQLFLRVPALQARLQSVLDSLTGLRHHPGGAALGGGAQFGVLQLLHGHVELWVLLAPLDVLGLLQGSLGDREVTGTGVPEGLVLRLVDELHELPGRLLLRIG